MSEANTRTRVHQDERTPHDEYTPPCRRVIEFLSAHYPGITAPLTGQDARALAVWAHLLDLYAVADSFGRAAAVDAMRALVRGAIQPGCRVILKRAIPALLDWPDEERLWSLVRPSDEGGA